jgi:hypothetical protein
MHSVSYFALKYSHEGIITKTRNRRHKWARFFEKINVRKIDGTQTGGWRRIFLEDDRVVDQA